MNCPTEASTCYRHRVLQVTRKRRCSPILRRRAQGRQSRRHPPSLSVPTGDVTSNVPSQRRATGEAKSSAMLHARPLALGG
jgi:hypothetical protein